MAVTADLSILVDLKTADKAGLKYIEKSLKDINTLSNNIEKGQQKQVKNLSDIRRVIQAVKAANSVLSAQQTLNNKLATKGIKYKF